MYYDISKIKNEEYNITFTKRRIHMVIPKVKCVCGCENVYFIEHPNSTDVVGIYCTMCGRWIKWANRNEKRLYKLSIKTEKGGTKYGY